MKWLRIISSTLQKIQLLLFTAIMYYLAIGTTSLLAKIINKKFLRLSPDQTSWEKLDTNINSNTMY